MNGICTMRLRLLGTRSLKEKRKIIRSLLDRLRHRFNVSVAEVGAMDSWREAVITVAHVSNDTRHIESTLAKVASLVAAECEVVEKRVEMVG